MTQGGAREMPLDFQSGFELEGAYLHSAGSEMSAWHKANDIRSEAARRKDRLSLAASMLMIFALSVLCWALLIAVFIGLRAVL